MVNWLRWRLIAVARWLGRRCIRPLGVMTECRIRMGFWPNILHPKRFTEHLARKRAFGRFDGRHVTTADKFAVREWVRARVGETVLTELYQVVDNFDDLDWDALPDAFIVKATHVQGGNFYVPRKASVNVSEAREFCTEQLQRRFGADSYEPFYLEIPPRLVVEEWLGDAHGNPPDDFKIYVFHGQPLLVAHMFDRQHGLRINYYDPNWRPLVISGRNYPNGPLIDRPTTLPRMLEIASVLGQDFEFCRVDLFSVGGKVLFGEITHIPGGGYDQYQQKDFDRYLGEVYRGRSVETISEWAR